MEGTVVFTDFDLNGNRMFGIQMHNVLFPADADDVLLRDLKPGKPVKFITDSETGKAKIVHPDKVIGCRSVEG